MPRCKNCKVKFEPKFFLAKYCENETCQSIMIAEARSKVKKQKEKDEKKATNLLKESLKTKSDYIKILQILVNKYVRIRDLGNSCISCNTKLTMITKYDAGHMYPTTYTFLRFHEDNINGQCVRCNRDLHGNTSEYRPRLEDKIGTERLQWLHAHRHDKADYSIEWLKEQIKVYKEKIKNYGNL